MHKLTFYNSRSEINSVSEAPSEGETRLSDDAIGKDADNLSVNKRKFDDNDIAEDDGIDINYRNHKNQRPLLKKYKKETAM